MANNRQDSWVVEGPKTLSALNVDMITGAVNGWFDASGYSYGSVQVTTSAGISAGAFLIEGTNDITTAVASDGVSIPSASTTSSASNLTVASAVTLSASSSVIQEFKITTRWIRVRISTALVGGTAQASLFLQQNVSQKTTTATSVSPYTGLSTFSLPSSAASTNATSITTVARSLLSISCSNTSASAKFVKLYNKASAPTVGTDIPVYTIALPATSSLTIEFGILGQRFTTGLAMAITGAIGDADATAVAAGDVKVLMAYV